MTDLATANATEEEKLKAMMSQSSEGFDPSKSDGCYSVLLGQLFCTGTRPSLLATSKVLGCHHQTMFALDVASEGTG